MMRLRLAFALLFWLLLGSAFGATRYNVFVDVSASINRPQRMSWLATVDKLPDRPQPGDAVTLLPLHNNTGGAAAMFTGESQPFDDDLPADDQMVRRRAFVDMRNGFRAALRDAISQPGHATETDIFSAVDRVPADDRGRHVVVLFISDMLQSTSRDIDMDKIRLTEVTIPQVIQAAVKRHHWTGGTLAGVRIDCLLPGISAEARVVHNDRLILKLFWDCLFRSIGASLNNFDTQL